MLHLAVEDAFENLLATWRTHESRQQQMRASLDQGGLVAQPPDQPGPSTDSAQTAAADQGRLLAQPPDQPGPSTDSAHTAAADQGRLLARLVQSRHALDQARVRMHKLRCTIYPEPDELEAIVESLWCEALDIVVHLRWSDRHHTRPGNFICPCGHFVPVNYAKVGNGD